jgi:hypothetical protein
VAPEEYSGDQGEQRAEEDGEAGSHRKKVRGAL